MPLKRVEVQAESTKAKKSTIPVFKIDGGKVKQYADAYQSYKDAEATLKLVRPDVEEQALQILFAENALHPTVPTTTIKVQDDDGGEVRVSFQDKYNQADPEACDACFTQLHRDINDYAVETTKCTLDAKFFLDASGNFDNEAYTELNRAIADTAARLGKPNPLSSKKVVTAKPGFHVLRWTEFTAEQNRLISQVLPNTVTISPLKNGNGNE
jgi:hypothetical protein